MSEEEPRERPRRGKGLAAILATALAVCAFALNYELERRFDRLHVFEENNVLFDTDPIVQLSSLSHGLNRYGRNLSHPNLANYFNPPVRILSRILTSADSTREERVSMRRSIGLLVVPVCSGLKALVVFFLFFLLGFSLLQAFLVTGLSVLSFSQVVFGSIPDHWALGGLAIALSFLLSIDLFRSEGRIRWWAWVLVGALAMGITITSICIVGLVFWVTLLSCRRRLAESTLTAAYLVLVSGALTGACYLAGNWFYETRGQSLEELRSWTERHVEEDPKGKPLRFPAAISNTVAPPAPRPVENRIGLEDPEARDYQFTLEGTPGLLSTKNPLGALLFALILVGAVRCLRQPTPQRHIATVALATLGFNGVLHAVWGQEYFLYSQHWHIAIVVLLAGVMTVGARFRTAGTVLFALVLVAVAVNTAVRIDDMLTVLSQQNPHPQ